MLLSGKAIVADGHHHDKKDTVVIIESPKDNHHHHCEEKRSLKIVACQWTRSYVREALAVVGGCTAYVQNQNKPNCIVETALFTTVAFTAGHFLKKGTKLFMYLNNIPKK
jgi:hypothetical protein